MKISDFTIFASIARINAFLHPLLNLGPEPVPERIAGRMGFPVGSFWMHKPKSHSQLIARKDKQAGIMKNAICSYPCQRVSHFVKLEEVLQKKGLDYDLRSVFGIMLTIEALIRWPESNLELDIILKTFQSTLMTSIETNSDGFIDIGKCIGSCRKASAESFHVSLQFGTQSFGYKIDLCPS